MITYYIRKEKTILVPSDGLVVVTTSYGEYCVGVVLMRQLNIERPVMLCEHMLANFNVKGLAASSLDLCHEFVTWICASWSQYVLQ